MVNPIKNQTSSVVKSPPKKKGTKGVDLRVKKVAKKGLKQWVKDNRSF